MSYFDGDSLPWAVIAAVAIALWIFMTMNGNPI